VPLVNPTFAGCVLEITEGLRVLREHYGKVALDEPRTPFALILWENCAYLVDDGTRSRTFAALHEQAGITPAALLDAGIKRVEKAIAGGGMQPAHRAAKIVRCAEIATQFAAGDLDATVRDLDGRQRRKLLKRFPGIADPGADKVSLLCGLAASPALDSNGLRVLERWGSVAVGKSYAAAYRAGVGLLGVQKIRGAKAVEAFALLRVHGRELCKRNAPLCEPCPLRSRCPYARS